MSQTLGRVVRKGRIRVDARKAMAKLREHLLVDLHLYAVEVVRAAVLAGASRIDVTFDADDVITFDGKPLEAAALPHLFEHLTGESSDEPTRHLRLLALAVNAALGLAPAWVALTSSSGGAAARVEWTPALVAAIERDEKPLPAPEAIALPAGMPPSGTRFHLRRKVGWDVVRRTAARTAPREVALLTEAAHCLHVPFFVNGAPPPPPSRSRALARATITLPGVRAAHVEIVRETTTAPHVDFCELGILLARSSFVFGSHFPMAEHVGVSPPVRVIIDAEALPTNASRSAIREDAPLFATIANVAAPALADAIAGIVTTVFGRGAVPDGVTVDASDPDALRDALGAFLCTAEASIIGGARLPDALRALLDLPLFHDGLGRPLSHTDVPRADPFLVWTGGAPVPEEMAPWAQHMVWRKGRLAERLFDARRRMDPDELAKLVKRGVARRRKLMATPAGKASVPDEACLTRVAFQLEDGPFAGLAGEVAIVSDPAAYARNLALRVFLEGRHFEAFPLPETAVPLPCVIALQWPGQITPKFAYDGVEPTPGFRAALAFAVRHAVLLCERFASQRPASGAPFDAASTAVLRAALATAALAPTRMYSAAGFEMPALAKLPALLRAPIWPTTEGGFISLQEVCEYAAKTGAVCVAAEDVAGRAVDGRPVVCGRSDELDWLAKCLQPTVAMVRYDRALALDATSARNESRAALVAFIDAVAFEAKAPIFHVEAPGLAYAVTVGASETRVWHGGLELLRTPLDAKLGGVTVALDDDSIVPNATWSGIVHATDQKLIARVERAYAEHILAALAGDERTRTALFHALSGPLAVPYGWPEPLSELSPSLQRYLVDRAARGLAVDASEDDRALSARIAGVPFLTMIDEHGEPAPASLGDVARLHTRPDKIPYLRVALAFKPIGWRPLRVSNERVLDALARWSGGRLVDAGAEIHAQERLAAREGAHARFRTLPALDPETVGPQGDASGPVVHVPPSPQHGFYGTAAALPRPEVDIGCALVEVLFEDRLVCTRSLAEVLVPVVARVSVLARDGLDGFDQLSPKGLAEASARVGLAAVDLGLALLARARQRSSSYMLFRDVRALRLVLALLSQKAPDARIGRALRDDALLWPTVQGDDQPYRQLRIVDGLLWAGTITYASWLPAAGAPTDLDRPILHIPPTPEGSVLVGILEKLPVKIRPVSDAVATLQAKRAHGGSEKPRLSARPVHPLLAQDLLSLGISGMEGEIALYESGESVGELSALDGETRRVLLDVSFPARAVARLDVLTTSAVPIATEQLGRAAVRLLVGLVRQLDQLPLFVRAHVRALVCRAVSKDRDVPPIARDAPVFPDIDGAWCSLANLQDDARTDWLCTFDPPPHAKARQEGRTLLLTTAEHLQLHDKINILNVTAWMRRDLEAERRREAPPVARLAVEGLAETEVITQFSVKKGALEGEIGLLQPCAAARRGLHVHTTHRPLCTIDDGPGWPLVAALNDDTLHPSRWFDQMAPAEETATRAAARDLATAHARDFLRRGLPPETEMRACLFLDQSLPPVAAYGSTDLLHVTGYVYLPSIWPVSPTMRLFVQGQAGVEDRAVAVASAAIAPTLPIGGALLVAHGSEFLSAGGAHRLALGLRAVAEQLLAPLLRATPDDATVRTYHWNLRLLGCTALGKPSATSADGKPVEPDAVISTLQNRGELWLTDRRGSVDGAFPRNPPPFVLLDEDSPLVRVLRARLPRQKLPVLGALPGAEAPDVLAPPSLPRPAAGVATTAPAVPAFDATEARPSPSASWFAPALAHVTWLLGGTAPKASERTGFADAVERALRPLRLSGEPVIHVHEVTRGKLVRYHKERRELSINVAHPALARHVAAPSPAATRRVCIALVAAALSEVNLALDHVTDPHEAQALLELLRQEAAAGAAPGSDA